MPQQPETCPCGSGKRPWWRDDWKRAEKLGEKHRTTWICAECCDRPTESEAKAIALREGAQLALTHLRLCGNRSESAAEAGSRAIPLLEIGLGLNHSKAAELALSRMKKGR